jgi:20S proteasome subunit alpha 7
MIEPSGNTYEYFGCAAGKGRQPAKTEMEKLSLGNKALTAGEDAPEVMSCAEGVKQMARIIHLLHGEESKDNAKPFELEMSWVCEASGHKHVGVPKSIIAEAVAWAKADIEEEEEDDEEEEMEE